MLVQYGEDVLITFDGGVMKHFILYEILPRMIGTILGIIMAVLIIRWWVL